MCTEKLRENRIRRQLSKLGYGLHKSHKKTLTCDDLLGYMIYHRGYNVCVAGSRFEYTLDDVEEWLAEEE